MQNFENTTIVFLKRKSNVENFLNFQKIYQIKKIQIAVSAILRLLIKNIDDSSKTVPVTAFPANPYFRSKSAEHDVTLTSFTADLSAE